MSPHHQYSSFLTRWQFRFRVAVSLIALTLRRGSTGGTVASGGAYEIWYMTVRSTTTIAASVVQLTIPVIVSGAGVVLLNEPITIRLLAGSFCVLGGVALVVLYRNAGRERLSRHLSGRRS